MGSERPGGPWNRSSRTRTFVGAIMVKREGTCPRIPFLCAGVQTANMPNSKFKMRQTACTASYRAEPISIRAASSRSAVCSLSLFVLEPCIYYSNSKFRNLRPFKSLSVHLFPPVLPLHPFSFGATEASFPCPCLLLHSTTPHSAHC